MSSDPKAKTFADTSPDPKTASSPSETQVQGQVVMPQFEPPTHEGDLGRLGRYRIVKLLGYGGMGAVYQALDERLRRKIALKVMLPKAAENGTAKERFLREARVAAQVDSDHVVPIYEADEIDGIPFISMKFLQGYSLDAYLKKKGLPTLEQSVRIGLEVATGLAAAHALGLVHRDIKPANVWLEAPNGRAIILDFGLAKPVETSETADITGSGAVVGTPSYMSPEQGLGETVTARSDLFSLGCLLYRLVTGRLPFEGLTLMAIFNNILYQNPKSVREWNPDVPEGLAQLIHQLLAKDPNQRPVSAKQVAEELSLQLEKNKSTVDLNEVAVVAPMAVSGIESNPFANIDSDELETQPVQTSPESPRQGLFLGLLLGALLLTVLLGGTLFAVFKFKLLEPSTPITPEKVTPTNPKPTTLPSASPNVPTDPDRRVAELVFSLGGRVQIAGKDAEIRVKTELPGGPFELTGIYLYESALLRDEHVKEFKFCKQLLKLELGMTALTNDALGPLGECLNLKTLKLDGTRISNLGMPKLAKLTGLHTLYLSEMPLTDEGLAVLAEFTQLENLNLRNTRISNETLHFLTKCPKLQALYLEGTPITVAGLKHLTELKLLNSLSLDQVKLNGPLTALGEMADLKYLSLKNCGLIDQHIAPLVNLKRLSELHVDRNKVTLPAMLELKKQIPEVRIFWDGGQVSQKLEPGLIFDDATTFVQVPKLANPGELPMTIEAWVQVCSKSGQARHIFLFGRPGGGLGIDSDGKLAIGFYNGKEWIHTTSVAVPLGQLLHVAGVVEAHEYRLYLNGKLVGQHATKLGQIPKSTEPAWIGKNTPNAAEAFFHGSMHGLRISKKARYVGDFSPDRQWKPDADTLALYDFLEGEGNKLLDHSGNQLHGFIMAPRWIRP